GELCQEGGEEEEIEYIASSINGYEQSDKYIVELYWSYGNEHKKLNDKSRHYTDLNLHILTYNYSKGETVNIALEYETNLGTKTKAISGVVNECGEVLILNIFENEMILTNGDENEEN
ncbi:hypothetical protein, partial [Rodentibacter pneumotropicus]|uniref:hypothetical protein n=1 Tax=Rodentibacter pneumotropicus TaxID=758 RepID=UPI001137734E